MGAELQGLSRSASFERAFFLLESLSVVRSPLVLLGLPTLIPAINFFHALLSLLSAVNNDRVEYYVLDILSACLAELNIDEVTIDLIDAFLSYLTPQQMQSNPRATTVVTRLLDKHRDKLERLICRWVKDVVIEPGHASGEEGEGEGGQE